MRKRVVGIIRVSQVRGREGESFASPKDQRAAIEKVSERDGLTLVDIHEELDVSGGKPLAGRPGLREAVRAVEEGRAEVVAAAYFDRLFRSLSTQAEVIERVERAGGQVLAVDVGRVSNGTAGQWLSGTVHGVMSEYLRRSARERTAEAQARAVERGALPWARTPLGYRREKGGPLAVDDATRPLVVRAFEMRDEGKSIQAIRTWLQGQGVTRSHRGVQELLASRIYLGEIRFGDLFKAGAHEAIIDPDLHRRVQARKSVRGPKPKSSALLARLGVLVCGNCGSRMSAATMPKRGAFPDGYPIYRCGSTNDCPHHMFIRADTVEKKVADRVKELLVGRSATASRAPRAIEALADLKQRQDALDVALTSFAEAGLMGERVAAETLTKLRIARDEAKDAYDEAVRADEGASLTRTVTVEDWDNDMSQGAKRALIRALIKRVEVREGRGAERVWIDDNGTTA